MTTTTMTTTIADDCPNDRTPPLPTNPQYQQRSTTKPTTTTTTTTTSPTTTITSSSSSVLSLVRHSSLSWVIRPPTTTTHHHHYQQQQQHTTTTTTTESFPPSSRPPFPPHSSPTSNTARHRTEFEILSKLGHGAYGTAFKVRNRVDSRIYALKRVKITPTKDEGSGSTTATTTTQSSSETAVLREVTVLSGLNDDHVVRYFGAWVERGDDVDDDDDESEMGCDYSATDEDRSSSSGGARYRRPPSSPLVDPSSSDDDERPTCHLCHQPYDDWEVGFEHWGLLDAVLQPLDLCRRCYLDSIPPNVDVSQINIRDATCRRRQQPHPHFRQLFILMEYCRMTLLQAVAATTSTERQKWGLFAQCARGLSYLHSRGVIHRDVKPSNIFVTGEGVVKIGDLGLAVVATNENDGDETDDHPPPTDHRNDGNDDRNINKKHHPLIRSRHVGTALYTAPEVRTGRYDEKCDVYSLGVVLFEIFGRFKTTMERIDVLQRLQPTSSCDDDARRRREVMRVEGRYSPMVRRWGGRMTAWDPEVRPRSREVAREVSMTREETEEVVGQCCDDDGMMTTKESSSLIRECRNRSSDDDVVVEGGNDGDDERVVSELRKRVTELEAMVGERDREIERLKRRLLEERGSL